MMQANNTPSPALDYGESCRVVIVEAKPLGIRREGNDLYALRLDVMAGGEALREVVVASSVPQPAELLLLPGSELPARRIHGGDCDALVIDWETALIESTGAGSS
jgi:hypothetical protein